MMGIGMRCGPRGTMVGAALVCAAWLAIAQRGSGCDTPVHRYALFNWAPAPYRAFYFYRGQPAQEDAEVNELLEGAATASPRANLAFEAVDVENKERFERLPSRVKKAWEDRSKSGSQSPAASQDSPAAQGNKGDAGAGSQDAAVLHVVYTSWGDEVYAGRLDAATARKMIASPLRTTMAKMIHEGNAGVFLLLCGSDRTENDQAEKVAREVMARVGPQNPPGQSIAKDATPAAKATEAKKSEAGAPGVLPEDSGDDAAPEIPPLRLGLVRLERSDAAEEWLVRSLATAERELPDASGRAMLFAVFGRGRVLPPCVGKGITAENLLDQIGLLGGPCSCMIKEENPGVDLLFAWDWDATAEALAASESDSRLLRPQDSDEEETGAAVPAVALGGSDSVASAAAAEPAVLAAPIGAVQLAAPSLSAEAGGESEDIGWYSSRQVQRFGVALFLVAVIVVALGSVFLRKHRHDSA